MPILDHLAEIVYPIRHPFLERGLFLRIVSLPFDMQPQTQTNWCWAATSTSVSIFYRASSTWTQCKVANGELGLTGCCGSPVPGACNVPWYLDRALTRTGNFVSIGGPISFADIVAEPQAGRVVGARVGWSGGGGHFMVIYGAVTFGHDQFLRIDDPIYGKSQLSLAAFSSNYQGSGTWTHAYRTKRPLLVFNLHLIPVPDILKRMLSEYHAMLGSGGTGEGPPPDALALPHRAYTLGLRDLNAKTLRESEPSFLRAFQVAGERVTGFIDISEAGTGGILQVGGAENPYSAAFERTLDIAAASDQIREKELEPRLLRIPALYTDILWLSGAKGKDYGLVIASPQDVPIARPMLIDELLSRLREQAKAQLDKADDPEIGS